MNFDPWTDKRKSFDLVIDHSTGKMRAERRGEPITEWLGSIDAVDRAVTLFDAALANQEPKP